MTLLTFPYAFFSTCMHAHHVYRFIATSCKRVFPKGNNTGCTCSFGMHYENGLISIHRRVRQKCMHVVQTIFKLCPAAGPLSLASSNKAHLWVCVNVRLDNFFTHIVLSRCCPVPVLQCIFNSMQFEFHIVALFRRERHAEQEGVPSHANATYFEWIGDSVHFMPLLHSFQFLRDYVIVADRITFIKYSFGIAQSAMHAQMISMGRTCHCAGAAEPRWKRITALICTVWKTL